MQTLKFRHVRIIMVILIANFYLSALHINYVLGQNRAAILENKLETATETEKAGILNQLSQVYLASSPAKSMEYGNQALELAKKLNNVNEKAQALINIGNAYNAQHNYEKAILFYNNSLKIYEKFSNKSGIAFNLNAIGIAYKNRGENEKAMGFCKKALKVYEEMNDKKGVSHLLSNIGDIYFNSNKHQNAINYYKKSLKTDEEINDKRGIVTTLNKIGSAYSGWGNYEEALIYLNRAYKTAQANNLASLTFAIRKNISTTENNFAKHGKSKTQYEIDREEKEEEYIKEIEEKYVEYRTKASEFLKKIDQLSIENQLKELKFRVKEDEYNKQLMLNRHEAEKKERELVLKNAEIALKDSEIAEKDAKARQQETQRNALIGGLALVLALVFLLYNRYQVKRKSNKLLEQQKVKLAKTNRQITGSINYAKRIQEAILPNPHTLKKHLPDSFVLYKPKAIVSGDFYWIYPQDGKIMFAAADCTGHGVPGAFMSIIGNDILNRVVAKNNVLQPGTVLEMVNKEIIVNLQQKNDEWMVKDGMDIAFCVLDLQKLELQFAGAHNPLYIIRNGELKEIKGNKLFIGMIDTVSNNHFTNHTIQLEKGDCLYTFSDGFADQKGGPNGKKFYYPPFQRLLIDIHQRSMEEQKNHLDKVITEWMGNGEQIDDILVFGIRV